MIDPPAIGRPRRVGGDGDPIVFAADEQADVKLDIQQWVALTHAVLADEGVRGHCELSLLFIDISEMTRLNTEFMDVDGATDVLAFPIDAPEAGFGPLPPRSGPDRAPPDPADEPLLLGDVVICPAVAAANAPSHAGTVDDELALLVVHGILHVLGYDHVDPEQTERMRARERELLEAHHWKGPAPTGFRQQQD